MRVKYEGEPNSRRTGISLPVPAGILLVLGGCLLQGLTVAGWAWSVFLILFGISLLIWHLWDRNEERIPLAVFLVSLVFLGIALFSQSEWLKALLNSRQ